MCFLIISLPSCHSQYDLDHWYESNLLFVVFLCMSPTRLGYDAEASQASQRGDNGQLEKRPSQILKYLEPLMKHQVEAHLYNVNEP
jgi:hypothetical protein